MNREYAVRDVNGNSVGTFIGQPRGARRLALALQDYRWRLYDENDTKVVVHLSKEEATA